MSDNDRPINDAGSDLLHAIRLFTRSTLLLQSAIAGNAGLNVTDAECIDFLLEMGPSTAGELARATLLTTGAITNVIDRLERAGFVRRERDVADRRKVIVTLLHQRHEKTHAHYTALANDVKELCSGYSETELDFLIRHTRQMKDIMDHHTMKVISTEPSSGT